MRMCLCVHYSYSDTQGSAAHRTRQVRRDVHDFDDRGGLSADCRNIKLTKR